MKRHYRPVPLTVSIGIAVLTCIMVAAIASSPIRSWIPADYRDIAVAYREGIVIVGLVLAVCGALIARPLGPDSALAGIAAQPDSTSVLKHVIAPVIIPGIVGSALGIGALLVITPPGDVILPVVASLLATTATLVVFTLLGLTCGVLVRPSLSVVLTMLIALAFAYLPMVLTNYFLIDTGYAALSIAPVWGIREPVADLTFVTATEVTRTVWFVLLASGLVWIIVARLERQSGTLPVATIVGTSLTLAAVGAVALVTSPTLFRPTPGGATCIAGDSGQICSPEVYASLLGEVAEIQADFATVVSAPMGDACLGSYDMCAHGHDEAVRLTPPRADHDEWRMQVASDLAYALSGVTQCREAAATSDDSAAEESLARSLRANALARVLAERAGYRLFDDLPTDDGVETALRELSDEQLGTWLARHQSTIRNCALPAEIPGG